MYSAQVKLVAGYRALTRLLAMERGEVEGLCGLSWSTIKTRRPMAEGRKIQLIVQAAFKKEPEMGDVPLIVDLTKDTEKLQILKLFSQPKKWPGRSRRRPAPKPQAALVRRSMQQ
jgi:hypothetical protein